MREESEEESEDCQGLISLEECNAVTAVESNQNGDGSLESFLEKPKVAFTVTGENSITDPKCPSGGKMQGRHSLHVCFRVATLMLALSLLYSVLAMKVEDTLIQLVGLFLSILLFFVAHLPEST